MDHNGTGLRGSRVEARRLEGRRETDRTAADGAVHFRRVLLVWDGDGVDGDGKPHHSGDTRTLTSWGRVASMEGLSRAATRGASSS